MAALGLGCTSADKTAAPDPLLGGSGIKPAVQTTSQPALGPSQTTSLPPLPPPDRSLSNAALASGVSRPFDDSRNLSIGGGSQGADGWGQKPPLLRQPVAMQPEARRDPGPASTPVSRQNPGLLTLDQAKAELAARGVLWQKSEQNAETGSWRFSCAVPNRQNPRIHRTYEATASDEVSAIRGAIAQIDKEQ
jgi:hypothetical protein